MSEDHDYGNGFNWQVEQWPYLVQTGTTIVVVRPGATSLEFVSDGVGGYLGRFGIRDKLVYDAGSSRFLLLLSNGSQETYFDFTVAETPGAFVGRTTPGNETVSLVYSAGLLGAMTRSHTVAGVTVTEEYAYGYGSGSDATHIVSVTLRRTRGSGAWTGVRRALYQYYQADEVDGNLGDLKLVVHQVPRGIDWTDEGTYYYRYYRGELGDPGFAHGLKYVVNPASYERLLQAGMNPLIASDAELARFADYFFEYDTIGRVTRETVAGGEQAQLFAYTTSLFADGPRNWKVRTEETRPDGSFRIVYTNYIQQLLLSDLRDPSSGQRWLEYQYFNDNYQVERVAKSSAFNIPGGGDPYDDSVADLAVQLKTNAGLIYDYQYGDGSSGKPVKYLVGDFVRKGTGGAAVKLREYLYTSHNVGGADGPTIYPVSQRTEYRDDAGTQTSVTNYDYDYHSGTNQIFQKTITLPVIPTSENGPGTVTPATAMREQYDLLGNLIWEQGPKGFIDFFAFDPVTAAMTLHIRDVDPSRLATPWTRPAGLPAPLHLVTDYENDALGRQTRTLSPSHEIDGVTLRTASWTVYRDAEHETLSAVGYAVGEGPDYESFAIVNPVTIRRSNADGQSLDQIRAIRSSTAGALCVSNSFPQTTWVSWSQNVYDRTGRLVAVRAYHDITANGSGDSGTNYDETSYGYDMDGRRNRVRSPGGTITRMTLDALGRTTGVWIGTSDVGATDTNPAAGGSGNNLVQIMSRTYSDDCDCGEPATEILYVDSDSSHNRVTEYEYDYRNRLVAIDGEENFYEERAYDNLHHLIRTDRRVGGAAGALISREQNYLDARGQLYKTERYGVDETSGDLTDPLIGLNWYDAAGNLVAAVAPGAKDLRAFTKSEFDGDGRNPISCSSVYTGSLPPSYADATTITDSDRVFDQIETTYDPAGNSILVASYRRYPGSSAVNKLTTSDARRFRTATWYDGIGRQTATATYGTSGDVRPSSPPESTDAVPVVQTRYDSSGRAFEDVDSLGRKTLRDYDALSRVVATTANSTGCECPGNDTDVKVRQAYNDDGHLVRLTADNPTTGPQTTSYIYGVTPISSALSSNDLLSAVIYPDAADGADRVAYAYNRQGQQVLITDQNGTVRELIYDKLGRLTIDRVVTLGSGVDGSVRRLEIGYDARGRVESRTSYSSASGGSVVNQLRYEYDAFGRVTREYQSHSGLVST